MESFHILGVNDIFLHSSYHSCFYIWSYKVIRHSRYSWLFTNTIYPFNQNPATIKPIGRYIWYTIYLIDRCSCFFVFCFSLVVSYVLTHSADHSSIFNDDVIKWKHFPHYWLFVGNSPVNSPHKGQWCGTLMIFFYLCLNKRLSKQSWGW